MFDVNDYEVLTDLISTRLRENWNKCDQLPHGCAEYNRLTNECAVLHDFVRKYDIHVADTISARF